MDKVAQVRGLVEMNDAEGRDRQPKDVQFTVDKRSNADISNETQKVVGTRNPKDEHRTAITCAFNTLFAPT